MCTDAGNCHHWSASRVSVVVGGSDYAVVAEAGAAPILLLRGALHGVAARRALQTLVSTTGAPGDPIVLFSDSDYANDPETRKSISGKATYLFGCLVNVPRLPDGARAPRGN